MSFLAYFQFREEDPTKQMVIWGGLRPISWQIIVDVLALFGFSFSAFRRPSKSNAAFLLVTFLLTILLSGNLTNRWTIIFPMTPFMLLQTLRLMTCKKWIHRIIFVLSALLIIVSGVFSVLFPAVELPPLHDAPYNVGVVDLFLPVAFEYKTIIDDAKFVCPVGQDHVSVRILYPTLDEPGFVPYLRPDTSDAFCDETMIAGAPPPLKGFGWMLHTWKLIQTKAKKYAQPLDLASGLPIIAFSHGLGGNADLYAFQTTALASHGYVVVVVDHSDGSAPVVPRKNGSPLLRNDSHVAIHEIEGRISLFRSHRRTMTEYRADELLATVQGIVGLNENNIVELERHNVSFIGKLNVNEIHYMGHSFGGATSFHAARKRPPTSVIAHEPACDWIPDGTRASLFNSERLAESQVDYTYWKVDAKDDLSASVHDHDMLILYSSEWQKKKWGGVDALLDMYERGRFGPPGGVSKVAVIAGAHHNEFSDTCMLTPLWLARATGLTGERNPLDTALEIHEHTISFLKAISSRRRI